MPAIAVAAAACGFGAVSVLAKVAYEAGATPQSLFASRVVLAALLLSPFALAPGGCAPARRSLARAGCAGLAFAAAGFLEFEALARLPAAVLVMIVFTAPVWVAVATWALGGSLPGRGSAALVPVVAIGLVLVAGTPDGPALDPLGVGLALGASLLFAIVFVLLAELVRQGPSIQAVGWMMASSAVVAFAWQRGGVLSELRDPATAACAVGVGALTAASLALLARGMERLSAFAAAVMTGAEPLAAALLSFVFLGEALTAPQVLGGLTIVGGVVAIAAEGADAR